MRLNDDDKRVLAAIFHGADAASVGVSDKQVIAAYKTLRTLGFIDIGGTLTQRGRHVAKSLPLEKVKNGNIQGQDRAGVDRKSRSRYRGRDQAGPRDRTDESCERSIAETADGTSGALRSYSGDLSGADGRAEPDSGAIPEATSDATGFDPDWD